MVFSLTSSPLIAPSICYLNSPLPTAPTIGDAALEFFFYPLCFYGGLCMKDAIFFLFYSLIRFVDFVVCVFYFYFFIGFMGFEPLFVVLWWLVFFFFFPLIL
jgi:hypothetical protein